MCVSVLVTRVSWTAGCQEVSTSISAETDLFVPVSSEYEVVLSCQVTGAEGYSPLWEISGRQTRSSTPEELIIETSADQRSSNLTVTRQGRESIGLDVISVQCHADDSTKFTLVKGRETLYIVQFGESCISSEMCCQPNPKDNMRCAVNQIPRTTLDVLSNTIPSPKQSR